MEQKTIIYLVDDDPSARGGIARFLRTAGYDVHTYESAEEFVNDAPSVEHGCLILDARMPGLSVYELQDRASHIIEALPIIFVTADQDPETRRKAKDLQAAGFFHKPVDGPALIDAIKWATDLRKNNHKKAN